MSLLEKNEKKDWIKRHSLKIVKQINKIKIIKIFSIIFLFSFLFALILFFLCRLLLLFLFLFILKVLIIEIQIIFAIYLVPFYIRVVLLFFLIFLFFLFIFLLFLFFLCLMAFHFSHVVIHIIVTKDIIVSFQIVIIIKISWFILIVIESLPEMKQRHFISLSINKILLLRIPWYLSFFKLSPYSSSGPFLQHFHKINLVLIFCLLLFLFIILWNFNLFRSLIICSKAFCTNLLLLYTWLAGLHVCSEYSLVQTKIAFSRLSHFLVFVVL